MFRGRNEKGEVGLCVVKCGFGGLWSVMFLRYVCGMGGRGGMLGERRCEVLDDRGEVGG